MAKMFYTIQEAAQKLGTNEDQIKQMAGDGTLQQFRDGNKLMFKREQIETLASESTEDGAEISLDESASPIPLVDSSDTDQIDLSETSGGTGGQDPHLLSGTGSATGTGMGTGVNVFEADEVKPADPMAQTNVTSAAADTEELSLESVSSGSGLLDLTRESDDTSLGAELLEEIYPGGEGADTKLESLTAAGTGAFESGMGLQSATGSGVAVEGFETQATAAALPAVAVADPADPAWIGLSIGLLLSATVALLICLIVGISALFGVTSGLTSTFTADAGSLWTYVGILFGGTVVLGLGGMFVGRALIR